MLVTFRVKTLLSLKGENQKVVPTKRVIVKKLPETIVRDSLNFFDKSLQ